MTSQREPTHTRPSHPTPSVRIRDRVGLDLPFSRGIMASSILATGMPTDRAYAVASAIQQVLDNGSSSEIPADALAKIAETAIIQHGGKFGDAYGRRYRLWRQTKRGGRPIIVVLSGAPGVGKSTVAARLAIRLGMTQHVTTDTIREVLRTVIPSSVLPELHASTYELDKPPAFSGFERQATAVASATLAVANRLAHERRNALLEGVHLLPGYMTRQLAKHPSRPIVVERLLVLDDEGVHRAQLKRRAREAPSRKGEQSLDHLKAIRHIQDYLTARAETHGVETFDLAQAEQLTQQVVDAIVDVEHAQAS